MRASELLLIVRAQNQASGALKRIAGDLRGLSAGAGLRARGQSLQIARQNLNLQRQRGLEQIKELENGTRRIAQDKARAQSLMNELQLAKNASNIDQRRLTTQGTITRNELKRADLAKKLAREQAPMSVRARAATQYSAAAADAIAYQKRLQGLKIEEEKHIQGLGRQQIAVQQLTAAEAHHQQLIDQARVKQSVYNDQLAQNTALTHENNKALKALPWQNVQALGRSLQHTGRIAQYGGLVLGGTLAVLANNAAKFGTSVTLAATQTRKIGQSFTATATNSEFLQKSIRGLMTQFPASADEMSKAAYDIYSSLNVSLPGGVKLLKVFNQAAVAGQTSLDEVAQAGITVMNDFRIGVPQMTKTLQQMFASVRFGRMTFAQFVSMMPQVAPAFASAGYGIGEMNKALAFTTRVMPRTGMVAAGLARLTEMFARKDFIAGAKKAGVNITDLHNRLLPLPTIIDKLAKAFPNIAKAIKSGKGDVALQNFFKDVTALGSGKAGTMGTIQGRRVFQFFVTQSKLAHQIYGQVAKDQDEFTNSLKAMEKTTGVRWGVFVNNLKALALAIGTDVIPALMRMAGPIQDLVKWWENLDAGTRRTAARFATYAAAFLLVGGAITWLVGAFVNLFGIIGRFTGLGGAMTAAIIGIAIAVTALQGDLHGLSDILDTITSFAFGSFTGFATTLGLASVAAIRLTGAMRGMAAAEVTMGRGGILASLLGVGAGAGRGARIGLAAGGLRGMFTGAAAGASAMGASLSPILPIVLAVGTGLLMWRSHMNMVRKEAESLKRDMAIGAAPIRATDLFQQMGLGVEGVERAKISMRGIQRTIADLRSQLSKATPAQRLELLDQIKLQTMDLADAQTTYANAVADSNKQFNAFTLQFQQMGTAGKRIQELRNQQKGLISDRQYMLSHALPIGDINEQIARIQTHIGAISKGMIADARELQGAYAGVVRYIAKIEGIKLPKGAIQDMFQTSKQLHRALTIPEMKAVVRAELDPRAIRKLPADLRRIFASVRAQRIKVEVDQAAQKKATNAFKDAQKAVPKALKFPKFTFPDPKAAASNAHQKAAKAFTPIHQKVIVDPPGNLAGIGASIVSGIQAGIDNAGPVSVQKVVIESITKQIEAGSPSRWAMREVGKPIVQGISIGMLQNLGLLEKTAMITANLLGGKILSGFDETKKKKLTAGLITKDIQSQVADMRKFNNAIARLTRRGAPREMVDQLAALGPDMAKQIAIIANMTEKEWRKYLRSWNRMQGQIKRSMRATLADQRAAMKEFKDQLTSTIRDMFDSLRDETASQFGDLFSNIDPATYGEGLKQAQEEYTSQMSDFQGQIADLNGQMIDAQKEAAQRLTDAIQQRKDELQSAFGELFSGDWIQGTEVQTKLDWGKQLGFDDLQKDLQSQVDKFKRWRADLTSLAAKVPPELAKQLEALGPAAVDKLDVLNSGTSDQLAQYVATWQDGQNQMMDIANKTTVDTSDITARMADIAKQIADVVSKMAALVMPHELTGDDVLKAIQAQTDKWMEYQGLLQGMIDKKLPAGLIEQISQMGPDAIPFMKAINSMTDTQLKELEKTWEEREGAIDKSTLEHLNRQLDLWFDYGVNIAQNIVKGIRSQGDYLSDYFNELIKALIEQTSLPEPKARPTDKTGPTHVGDTASQGPGRGNVATAQYGGYVARTGMALIHKGETFSGVNGEVETGGDTYYNLTVNQAKDESLSSTLEKATFRLANRR